MQMGGAGGMIKSMTGFGRGEAGDEIRKIIVEIKSVNHRYLDLNVKLPRKLNAYEVEIRNVIKSRIVRGKLDVFITLEETKEICKTRYQTMMPTIIKQLVVEIIICFVALGSTILRKI